MPSGNKSLVILGSTGSIGESTLSVVARHPDRYRIKALTANTNAERLLAQCEEYKPEIAVLSGSVSDPQLAANFKAIGVELLMGTDALSEVVAEPDVDMVMCAIVGSAGLPSSLSAARAGKRILLANKESLVMSGDLFMQEVERHQAELLPIDSEHNAIFQCLPTDQAEALVQGRRDLEELGISKILLTGSGGPFRTLPLESLKDKTPDEACNHPNWSMGRKISVDSATMMNKGLELIEAHYLFHAESKDIDILIHPESMIHSMVQYLDGSVIAQMGQPDMCTPIAYGLGFPERIDAGVKPLDFVQVQKLTFEAPDEQRFPSLRLSRAALEAGGSAPAMLNAANEVAVDAFLNGQIRFTDITETIEYTLNQLEVASIDTLDAVLLADQQAREMARQYLKSLS